MRNLIRSFALITLVIAALGLDASLSWVGALLLTSSGFANVATQAGPGYASFLLVVNLLDLFAYAGLAVVGLGLLGLRGWVRRPALFLGAYSVVMAVLEPLVGYGYGAAPSSGLLPAGALLWLVFGAGLLVLVTRRRFAEELGLERDRRRKRKPMEVSAKPIPPGVQEASRIGAGTEANRRVSVSQGAREGRPPRPVFSRSVMMDPKNPYQPPQPPTPVPSSLPKALPGSSVDFGRCLGFFFQDPAWGKKLLFGSLFSLLTLLIVGTFFVTGYMIRVIRRSARGEPYPLPEWDDLGGLFVDGARAIGAYLLYVSPVVVVFVVGLLLLSFGSGGEGSAAAAAAGILVAMFVSVVLLGIILYLPAALTRLAIEERFGAAFEIEDNLGLIRRNFGNYVVALLAFILANFISQFGILLCCIGLLPASFWASCVMAYSLGEVALRDRGKAMSGSVATRGESG